MSTARRDIDTHKTSGTRAAGAAGAAGDTGNSLPAWIYCSDEFLALEREHVFAPSWQLVCHESDIPEPGDYHTFFLLGDNVVVMRDDDGGIHAFHNVCRHRGARLLDGETGHCNRRIVCPYHAWTYKLNGNLVGVPFKEEYDHLDMEKKALVHVEHDVYMGFVFIRMKSGGPSLADTMAPAHEEMSYYRLEKVRQFGKPGDRFVNCNWKNASDNYNDALHIRVAHKGLDSLVGKSYGLDNLGLVNRLSGDVLDLNHAGLSVRAYRDVLPDVEHLPAPYDRKWLYYQLWPNLAFNLYPDQVETLQFVPVNAQTHLTVYRTYALPDERREMKAARYLNIRINRQVGEEDRNLIERVQAGMNSRSYTSGPFGRNETCLRGFATKYRDLMPVCKLESQPPAGRVASINDEMREAVSD